MLRYLSQPLHARILVGRIGLAGSDVGPARDSLVDDGLLLFLQQSNQFLLRTDVAPDASVNLIKKADDGSLLRERRNTDFQCPQPSLGDHRIGYSYGFRRQPTCEGVALARVADELR